MEKSAHPVPESIPKRKGIFFRTVLLSWLVIIFTVIIFVFAIIPYQKEQLQNEMKIQAGVAFSSVSQVAESSIVLEDYSAIVDHCITLIQKNKRILYVVITRRDGFSLIHTPNSWTQKTLAGSWLPGKNQNKETGQFIKSDIVKQVVYNVSFSFRYSGIDWGWIHIGLTPDKFYSDLKALYVRIFWTSLLAISLGMVASYAFARRLSRPIQILDRVARRIRTGDLSARVKISTGDEVESLADSFNRTAEHLKTEIIEKELEIRERIRAEEAFRESEAKYQTIIESIEDGYYEVDIYGNITFTNEVMCKILGYSDEELVNMNSVQLIGEKNKKKVFRVFANVFLSGKPKAVFGLEINRKDGEKRQIETSIALIQSVKGEKIGFRGMARDVDERKKYEENLIYTAYHDALTGLKNRKWFYEKLETLLVYSKRYQNDVILYYIDIDNFKQVNDEFGHEAGDKLLQIIAGRLKSSLRETDFISRIGGDEFTVILASSDQVSPEIVAQKIIESTQKHYIVYDQKIDCVSSSIGISIFPKDAADLESLVKNADKAMYQAKEKGNCFVSYNLK